MKRKGQIKFIAIPLTFILLIGFIIGTLPDDHRISQCTDIPDEQIETEEPTISDGINYLQNLANQFFGLATCNSLITLGFNLSVLLFLGAAAAILIPG